MIQDLIIVGGGPAGITAAIYMGRAGKSVTIFEALAAGGQAAFTNNIENYPGFEGVNGFDLSDKMRQQAEHFGANFEYDSVTSVEQDPESKIYTITTGLENTYQAKSILISTGTKAKYLGIKGEGRLFGNGISTCAVCDAPFYKGKPVAVIGGGNSALEESLYLADAVGKVYVIHRRDEFRADHYVQQKAKQHPNIEFILDSVVDEFIGEDTLSACAIRNLKTNETFNLEVDGAFLYVGLDASTKFLDDKYKDPEGFLIIDDHNNVDGSGMFAAGDCCAGSFKQVVIACGDGAKASYHIAFYLATFNL